MIQSRNSREEVKSEKKKILISGQADLLSMRGHEAHARHFAAFREATAAIPTIDRRVITKLL
jgi:hypothetical protein